MPSYPPPAAAPTPITNAGAWAATTVYALNAVYLSPNGDYRLVKNAYTSGGSYGTTDTNNTLPVSPTYATLGTQYAPLGAAYKQVVAASGDIVSLGLPVASNGIPIVTAVTVTDLEIDMDYPAIGTGSTSFVFTRFRPSDQSNLTLGTVTLASGKRSATNGSNNSGTPVITNASLLAGDRILVRNQSLVTSPTFLGQGVYASIAFGGTLATMPNPSATTTPTAISISNGVTLNWTAGANSTGTLIFRDSIPWALVGTNTWTDTNLVVGVDNHTYTLAAISPGGCSATSAGVTQGPLASYSYFSQSDGTPVVTDFTVTLGTNANTAVTVTSNVLLMTSGNSGVANATQDKVNVQWIKDTTGHTGWRRSWKFNWPVVAAGTATMSFLLAGTGFVSLGTSFTTGLQVKLTTGTYQLNFKAPSVNGGASQNLTATGGPATVTSASGQVPYPTTVVANTDYGMIVEMLPQSGGTQTVNVWMGTAASFDAGTLYSGAPQNVITLSSANVTAYNTALPNGGFHWWTNESNQTNTATSIVYKEKALTISPLTASNS